MLKTITSTLAVGALTLSAIGTAQANDQPPHTPPRVSQQAGNVGATTLWAYVDAAGNHVSGSGGLGLVSTTKLSGSGQYEVLFRRGIANFCVYLPSIGNKGQGGSAIGTVTAVKRGGNNKGLFIQTRNVAGDLTDMNFNVLVYCTT